MEQVKLEDMGFKNGSKGNVKWILDADTNIRVGYGRKLTGPVIQLPQR